MGGGGSTDVCEFCGHKYGDHDTDCEYFDKPKKCTDCGAEMELVEKYDMEWVQEVYTYDHNKHQWVHKEQIMSNLDLTPDQKFFSCPNFDSDEEYCVIDGVAYREGKALQDHEL